MLVRNRFKMASQKTMTTTNRKKKVQFLSIFARKFKNCLNLIKIHIYHLKHVCMLVPSNAISYFFDERNVSTAVSHNEINIFYVISHDKVIMWVSLWTTAADIVTYLKTLRNWCLLLRFMIITGKCTVYDVLINLLKVLSRNYL